MTLSLLALIVLALVILAFVLEPILRAREDAAVLDAVALPRLEREQEDDVDLGPPEADQTVDPTPRRASGMPASIEPRPAGDAP